MIHSYPTIYQIGHKAIQDIFSSSVIVEEKIDGSQFSFWIDPETNELECRSKGKQMFLDAPEKMFTKAIQVIEDKKGILHPGWIYRCEFLGKPKHNTLAYDRVPKDNLIVFDVAIGNEEYLTPQAKKIASEEIGLECVPFFYDGIVNSYEMFSSFLEQISILGGSTIEGVVIKNYSLFTQEKKVAMGKYVSEKFKEVHNAEWRKNNPSKSDIVTMLILKYKTPARWNKAIQHIKERGELEGSPRDIGRLIIEVGDDIQKECEEEIKDVLFKHFWSNIRRGIVTGLPEWYKEELARLAFEEISHE